MDKFFTVLKENGLIMNFVFFGELTSHKYYSIKTEKAKR